MIQVNKAGGRHYNLTTNTGGSSNPVAPSIGKIDIVYVNGNPVTINKYDDAIRTTLLSSTTIEWAGSNPSSTVASNYVSGKSTATVFTWLGGKVTSIDKTITSI
jgi:hypothetical protein